LLFRLKAVTATPLSGLPANRGRFINGGQWVSCSFAIFPSKKLPRRHCSRYPPPGRKFASLAKAMNALIASAISIRILFYEFFRVFSSRALSIAPIRFMISCFDKIISTHFG
jgi:hypothetical protein